MVKYFIDSKDTTQAVYRYYPEGNTDKAYGLIKADLVSKEISIVTVAEGDHICRTSADELNEMRDTINKMRFEIGEPPLTEEELPTATEDEEWYCYADHAVRKLTEELNKGNIPESGTVAWY